MNTENQTQQKKTWTKEEVIAAIKECAAKLGRVPTQRELKLGFGLRPSDSEKHFGNYSRALEASGLEGRGAGYAARMKELFTDWAVMVREAGAVPSLNDYELRSRHSIAPLRRRFGSWGHVTKGLVQYAVENNLEQEWGDVLEIARRHQPHLRSARSRSIVTSISTSTATPARKVFSDRPVYGALLIEATMAFCPVNEMGVVCLFGAMANKLGFVILWIGTQYPDCEAFWEVEPGRWQRVRIEFEFYSRNFLLHLHDPKDCDLIVCWEHNWAECPLPVVELRKEMAGIARDRA